MAIILKDLNNFLTLQLVYNQMWLNLLMDDCHFNNTARINKFYWYLIKLWKIKLSIFKKWTYLHNGNNIAENLTITFLNSQRL